MKPQFKLSQRLLSILLTAVMLWGCCSQTIEVFADSISTLVPENATNNPYNQDVVDAMQALCTEGEDAVEILDTLYSYGLIDETGNVVTNGTFSVVENSESLTLTDAQLVALAAERKAQGLSESTITIDGTELTWAQIETLLNIRDTVGALQDWMSTGERFDDDDMDMMDSLASELAADGLELEGFDSSAVKMMALNPASTNLTANTMNHNARVTVSFANSNISDADQDITVNISVSPVQTDYPISFDVQAVSGTGTLSVKQNSASAGISMQMKAKDSLNAEVYTITLGKGVSSGSFTVHYTTNTSEERSGKRIATLQFSNIQNALFNGDKRADTLILTATKTDASILAATKLTWEKTSNNLKSSTDKAVNGTECILLSSNDAAAAEFWSFDANSALDLYSSKDYLRLESWVRRTKSQFYDFKSILNGRTGKWKLTISLKNNTRADRLPMDRDDERVAVIGGTAFFWKVNENTSIPQMKGYHDVIYEDERLEVINNRVSLLGRVTHSYIGALNYIPSPDCEWSNKLQGMGRRLIDKEIPADAEPQTHAITETIVVDADAANKDTLDLKFAAIVGTTTVIYKETDYNYNKYTPMGGNDDNDIASRSGVEGIYVQGEKCPSNNIKLESVSVPNGVFYSGQQLPIVATFSGDGMKINDALRLKLSTGEELKPVEIDTLGHSVTFLYTVPEKPAGQIAVSALYKSGTLLYVNGEADDILQSDKSGNNGFTLTNATGSKISGTAKMRNYRDYAFTGISASIDDGKAGDQWVTVKLTPSTTNDYLSWIISGGTAQLTTLTDLLNERTDLKSGNELAAALKSQFCTNEAYYKVSGYLKNIYISVDGGSTRYPVFVVTNDQAEKQMQFAAYYKARLNTSGQNRTDTIEVYLNQADDSKDYFSENSAQSAPQLIAKCGANGFAVTGKTYTVKNSAFMTPGVTTINYPTDNPFQSNWLKLVDNDQSKLVTYYADLEEGVSLLPGSGVSYKQMGSPSTSLSSSGKEQVEIAFSDTATYTVPQYKVTGTNSTEVFRIDEDLLTLSATIDNSKNYTYTEDSDFLWVSSDPDIATIRTGTVTRTKNPATITIAASITPTGRSGSVHFSLYATNGGIDGYAPTELCRSIDLLCQPGTTPILRIPSANDDIPELLVKEGNGLTIGFTSTVATVNKYVYDNNQAAFDQISDICTDYKISVYELNTQGTLTDTQVFCDEKNALADEIIAEPGSFEIPVDILTKTNGSKCSYQAIISSVVQTVDRDGTVVESPVSAKVNIHVLPSPPKVTLKQLSSYSCMEGQAVNLNWTLSNVTEAMTATLKVVNSANQTVKTVNILNSTGTTLSGLTVPAGQLKENYVVTTTVSGDDIAPAVDSCIITVYSSDILKIFVEGDDKGSSYTLDNHKRISDMLNQDGTITLNGSSVTLQSLAEDVNLKALISINYGEYVWGQLSDQIQWTARDLDSSGNEIYHIISYDENGNVIRSTTTSRNAENKEDTTFVTNATLNFAQGGSYSNINSYSYTSYSPYSDFMVSGLSEGKTRITAIHAATGMQDTLDVETIKLDNQFYLFQFYPKLETTVTYTNGNGVLRVVKSNANGELALYEEASITGNVQLFSTDAEDHRYVATIEASKLSSGEQDAAARQTYPVNVAKLRDVATVTLYIPGYEGKKVTIRGGVYKNGGYCSDAKIGASHETLSDGKLPQNFKVDSNGKVMIYMDSSQFYTEDETDEIDRIINGGDELEYIFELRFYENGNYTNGNENYVPRLIHMSAKSDLTSVARAGEQAVELRTYAAQCKGTPVVNDQVLMIYDREGNSGTTMNIYHSTSGIGISYLYPHSVIESEILMWGETANTEETHSYTFSYRDKNGYQPNTQVCRDVTYPFSSIPVVLSTWNITNNGVKAWRPSGSSAVLVQHYAKDGNDLKD